MNEIVLGFWDRKGLFGASKQIMVELDLASKGSGLAFASVLFIALSAFPRTGVELDTYNDPLQ